MDLGQGVQGLLRQLEDGHPVVGKLDRGVPSSSPRIEIHLVDSNEKPSGIGEPGTAVIGPAVANAVFAATGQRLRKLPLRLA